jgi:hypothetical protein
LTGGKEMPFHMNLFGQKKKAIPHPSSSPRNVLFLPILKEKKPTTWLVAFWLSGDTP